VGRKKYLEITEKLKELSPYSMFDRSIVHIMADLQGFKDDYPEHKDLRITVESGGWDNPDEFYLMGTRTETDIERDKRLVKAQKVRKDKKSAKDRKTEQEKEQLKELLRKHGGDLQFDIQKLMEE